MCISFHPNLLHEHKLEQDVSVGKQNLVKLNAYMIQFLPISLLKIPHNFPIYFNGSVMLSLDSVNILSIDITSTLFEEHNIIGIAESASKKLGVLFQSQNFFILNSCSIYTKIIYPCEEYCSLIWSGSRSLSIVERIESKAIRFTSFLGLI